MTNLSKRLTSIVAMLSVFGSITFSLPVNTYSEETKTESQVQVNNPIAESLKIDEDANKSVVESGGGDYGLADNIQDGAILHAWCWSFNTIKENMQLIAECGYTSVQTSPVQECKVGDGGSKDMSKWWWHYQPIDYKIGNYQLGTEEEFKEMCAEAHKYGINIIVDAVMNHMTSDWNAISSNMQNRDYYHTNEEVGNWNSRYEVTQKALLGLWDMNTQNPEVQQLALNYLKSCVADGADGFRYDAAKHIELPDDNGFGGNYWPTVLNNGAKFQYGETLQDSISREGAYGNYMGVTASNYGKALRDSIGGGSISASTASNLQVSASKGIVTWVESHDNFANDPSEWGASSWMNDEQIKLTWAVIGARKAGTPLFFSRPKGAGSGNRFPGQSNIGDIGSDLFKNPEVVAVNKFRNAMVGEGEEFEDNNGCLVIKRGNKGVVIINFTGQDKDITVKTGMESGEYTDQALGGKFTASGSEVSGKVKAKSVAVVYAAEPIISGAKVSASVESCKFKTESIDVTLNVSNATEDATYSIDGGEPQKYTDGTKITLGKDLDYGESVTLTLKATGEKGEVEKTYTYTKQDPNETLSAYLKMPKGWSGEPTAYIYDLSTDKSNDKWPGTKMTKVSDGLYSIEVPEAYSKPAVIFVCGNDRYPADQEKGLELTDTSMVYDGDSWSEYIIEQPTRKLEAGKVTVTSENQYVGEDVTIKTDKATGGSGDITYQIEVDGEVISKFSDKTEATWTPKEAKEYTIKVIAKDAKGNEDSKEVKYEIKDKPVEDKIEISEFNYEADKLQVGSEIKLSALAKCSNENCKLKYQFVAEKDGEEISINEDLSQNEVTWMPTVAGKYTIYVVVTDENGQEVVSNKKKINVAEEIVPEKHEIEISKFDYNADKLEVGFEIELSALAKCSIDNCKIKYQFVAEKDGEEININKNQSENEVIWVPEEAGEYTVYVIATDENGEKVVSDKKVLTIEEKEPEKPATSTPTPGDNVVPDDDDNEEPDDKPNTPTADSAPLALLGALSLGSLILMKNKKLNNK